MVANLIGTHAGMVWLIGDDPGAWGSQNEQDSRYLGAFAEVPMLEPSSPQEGYEMMRYAFDLSERCRIPVIIREVQSYSLLKGPCQIPDSSWHPVLLGSEAAKRWISFPLNVLDHHARLHQRNRQIASEFERSPFNVAERKGSRGLLAAGLAWHKFRTAEAVSARALSLFKLGTLFPLPERSLADFLSPLEEVLILEENEPFLEEKIKALAQTEGLKVKVRGKLSGEFPREGEIFPHHIFLALEKFLGALEEEDRSKIVIEKKERPLGKGFCEGCPYTPLFEAIREVSQEAKIPAPIITADPGCAVRLNLPPFEMLNLKYCMGASIALAAGVSKAGVRERVVAACGDSSFYHTGINALMDAVHHQADILVILLDNGAAALTGLQPHPGIPRNARGEKVPAVTLEEIVQAMPIDFFRVIDMFDKERSKPVLREGLTRRGLGVIIARGLCPLLKG
ncbi:MAG: thiamine pyrophosphate-dependent enzyme, partial [candidate division NC10 bacterium]|nr:thiamine pyrophosphate-dependent enzyme [candidate division NC10 bacterium]